MSFLLSDKRRLEVNVVCIWWKFGGMFPLELVLDGPNMNVTFKPNNCSVYMMP